MLLTADSVKQLSSDNIHFNQQQQSILKKTNMSLSSEAAKLATFVWLLYQSPLSENS